MDTIDSTLTPQDTTTTEIQSLPLENNPIIISTQT